MRLLDKAQRWLPGLAASPALRFALFCALALIATGPFLTTAHALNGFRDAQVLWQYEDSARRTVVEFGQLPLWNPYYCGGMYGLGSPQGRFASPPFLLSLLFGTAHAEPLTIFLMVLVALEGAFRYLRARGASRLGALLAAPVFGLGGMFAAAPFLGWINFLGFALLPWALLGTRRAASGALWGAALTALAFAWMTGFGGTYVVPITAVACVIEVLTMLPRRRGRLAFGVLATTLLLVLGLAAFRLVPIWDELGRAPRVIGGVSGHSLLTLLTSLFGSWPPYRHPTWFLVGIPAGVLALFGLRRKRALSALLPAVLWGWLALGYGTTPSLFGALRQLPGFKLLRYPERCLLPVTLLVALAAAWAVTDLAARFRSRRFRWPRLARGAWGLAVVALLLNVPLLVMNFGVAAQARTLKPIPEEVPRPFHQARGNRWAAPVFGPMSRGSLSCWEAYPVPQSALLRGDLQQEAYLNDPAAGTVEERRWSPNRLDLRVSLSRPARLLLNQNHHSGWKSSVGQVVSHQGLLAVELPVGEHEVTLRFLPRSAVAGGLTSILAALALGLMLLRRMHPGVRLALAVAPLLVGLWVLGGQGEPPSSAWAPLGPEGELLIDDAPPDGARRLEVRFAGGVTLEAASLEVRPEAHQVRLELDWRTEPGVSPGLGIFVHVEPGEDKRINADHPQVSGAFLLEDGPPGKTLRDVLLFDVPAASRKRWNVWVGLWAMRGNGERMEILDSAREKVEGGRVLIGSVDAQ